MHIETLIQPIFLVYIILLLLQFCSITSINKLVSSVSSTLFLIIFSFLIFLIPLGENNPELLLNTLAIISFILVFKVISTNRELNLRALVFPLILSLISGGFIAFKAIPFEYPGDISTYLNTFITLSLDNIPKNNCFSDTLVATTYDSSCTLVKTLLSIGKINVYDLISSYPQRLFLGLEVSIMALSYFRLLLPLKLSPIAVTISWFLLLFGIGNQSILFVLNHGLQGSILASCIFMEISCFSYRILIKKDNFYKFITFISVICLGILIQLRIHGAFALSSLILLTPASLLLGFYCLFINKELIPVTRKTLYWYISSSIVITIVLISAFFGWNISHVSTRSIVYWSWLERLNIPLTSLPASYILKTPVSRPETLAIIGLLIGCCFLCFSKKELFRSFSPLEKSYALLTSIFSLSLLFTYLMPPFSNLFLNINASEAAATHYRLMWSSEIFSPLPLLMNAITLKSRDRIMKSILLLISFLVSIIILVPFPNLNTSSSYPQFLWSKTRHGLGSKIEQTDQTKIVKSLLPIMYKENKKKNKSTFLADEIINFSLSAYSSFLEPLNPPRRIFKTDELKAIDINYNEKIITENDQQIWLQSLKLRPDWIIQQQEVGNYYSPYSEIRVYDNNIVDSISKQTVNRLSNKVLRASGYKLIKHENPIYKIWYKEE